MELCGVMWNMKKGEIYTLYTNIVYKTIDTNVAPELLVEKSIEMFQYYHGQGNVLFAHTRGIVNSSIAICVGWKNEWRQAKKKELKTKRLGEQKRNEMKREMKYASKIRV